MKISSFLPLDRDESAIFTRVKTPRIAYNLNWSFGPRLLWVSLASNSPWWECPKYLNFRPGPFSRIYGRLFSKKCQAWKCLRWLSFQKCFPDREFLSYPIRGMGVHPWNKDGPPFPILELSLKLKNSKNTIIVLHCAVLVPFIFGQKYIVEEKWCSVQEKKLQNP